MTTFGNLTRRQALQAAACGFGGLAFDGIATAAALPRGMHHAPRAKRVIMLFMHGGPSQVDTFDYKPELVRRAGQPLPGTDKLVTFQGENGNLTAPVWKFRPRGRSGKMVSDLLPHLAALADELCFVHSLTAKSNTHGPAENQMSTGFTLDGFPSAGAWVTYAMGSANADLPAFISVGGTRGESGFLGMKYAPFTVQNAGSPPENVAPPQGADMLRRAALFNRLEGGFSSGVQMDAARAHREVLGEVAPANTMLYVAGLIGEGLLVEVELDAEVEA